MTEKQPADAGGAARQRPARDRERVLDRAQADRPARARRRHRARRHRPRRDRPGGRRGLLQHRHDRLPGDPDRSLLCRPDHHLHLPAYRQCRHQRGGHRDRQHGGDAGRARRGAAHRRSPSRRTTAPPAISTSGSRRAASSASAGIDTRALTACIREQGHAERRDRARARRQVRPRRAQEGSARVAGPRRHGPRADGDVAASASPGTRRRGNGARATAGRTTPEFHVVAIDYGIKRNILRLLAGNGCKVTVVPAHDLGRGHPRAQARRRVPVQRPRRPGGDRRICRAGDPRA